MVTDEHTKQANNITGREIDYIPVSDVTFNTDGEVERTEASTTTLYAKVKDIDEVSSSVLNVDDEGKYPDDGLVIRVNADITVEKDDLFEIDGETYEVFKLQTKEGLRGQSTGQHAFVQPQR